MRKRGIRTKGKKLGVVVLAAIILISAMLITFNDKTSGSLKSITGKVVESIENLVSGNESDAGNLTEAINETQNADNSKKEKNRKNDSGAEIIFLPSVKDSEGNSLDAKIIIKDAEGRIVERLNSDGNKTIPKGIYDIEIEPKEGPVTKIVAEDVDVSSGISEIVDIDSPEVEGYVQSFAINPKVDSNFSVTATAVGNRLFKCKDWNFEKRKCTGSWSRILDIVPGEEYTFEMNSDDPGFAESNITGAEHLDENRTFLMHVFNETTSQDGIWSGPVYNNQYVRATFDTNLTNTDVIDLYVRNTHRPNNYIII